MPKNRPTPGQQNWGDPLIAHLNQISPNGGGINFGTTAQRPVLTTDDDGYTYFDTTTKQVVRWDGTTWEIVLTGTPNNEPPAITINGRTVNNLTLASNGVALTETNGNLTLNFELGSPGKGLIVDGLIFYSGTVSGVPNAYVNDRRIYYSGPTGIIRSYNLSEINGNAAIVNSRFPLIGRFVINNQVLLANDDLDLNNSGRDTSLVRVEIV